MAEGSGVVTAIQESHTELVAAPSTISGVASTKIPSASYAAFTIWYLAFTLSSSTAIFMIGHAFGYNSLGTVATVFVIVSLLAASLLATSVIRAWRRIVATGELKQRPRRVFIKAVVLTLVFFTTFGAAGYTIGQSGVEAAQVAADLEELHTTGNRVSKARAPNGVATIAWYIQMYKSIDPDVERLEIVLRRLVREYPVYRAKFSQNDMSVADSVSGFNVGIRRMDLLKKQIAVARRIEGLDATTQMETWHSEMIPLLDQEDVLDKSK